MMRYLLDTNACIALLNETSPSLLTRIRRHPPTDVGLPAPVAYELYYGAYKRVGAGITISTCSTGWNSISFHSTHPTPVQRGPFAVNWKQSGVQSGRMTS